MTLIRGGGIYCVNSEMNSSGNFSFFRGQYPQIRDPLCHSVTFPPARGKTNHQLSVFLSPLKGEMSRSDKGGLSGIDVRPLENENIHLGSKTMWQSIDQKWGAGAKPLQKTPPRPATGG